MTNLKKHLGSFIIILLLIVLAIGSTDTSEEGTQETKERAAAYTISAEELSKEYSENEVSADEKYEGEIVIVYGTIDNIGKDIMDTPYISLEGKGFMSGVQCMFDESEASSFRGIAEGDYIRIKGKVDGKSMGSVLLQNSSIQ